MRMNHRLKRLPLLGFLLGAVTLGGSVLSACGPVEYINQVSRKASSEVEAAKSVRADKYSPYWYTLAVEYLHKAREEAAHADYQAANRFGKRSAEAAAKARVIAVERAADPSAIPVIPDADEPEEDVDIIDTDSSDVRVDDEDPLVESSDKEGK